MSSGTTLRRILVDNRWVVVFVALVLVIDLGLYVFGVYPGASRVAAARTRASLASDRLVVDQRAVQTARLTMANKTRAETELEQFYGDVLPQDLAGARGMTFPRLSALARQAGLALERRSSQTVWDEESQLWRLRTTMLLAGQYPQIRRFVHSLETSPEFLVIDEVALSQGNEFDAGLVLILGVSTYYRTGSVG